MTHTEVFTKIINGVKQGSVIPYLGPGVLQSVKSIGGNESIPADSESLILAMNNGRPMAPKLMYEFPRAAMSMELKKGRSFVTRFLTQTYLEKQWQRSELHDWLASVKPDYVIDTNRDTQLQNSYQQQPHTLVVGVARIGGTDYRYKLYHYDGGDYVPIVADTVNPKLPVLFKPMGSPIPKPDFIASDADYVDYITELMGGFAIPRFLKSHRQGKQYLVLGLRLLRDTERMILSDMIYSADSQAGWALIPNPSDKEKRFCDARKIEILETDWTALIAQSSTQNCHTDSLLA